MNFNNFTLRPVIKSWKKEEKNKNSRHDIEEKRWYKILFDTIRTQLRGRQSKYGAIV